MPTKRPRHTLTETPDIAAALDVAAREWPELARDRTELMRKLVVVGSSAALSSAQRRTDARRARIRDGAGAATGLYPPGALDSLREDWPE